MPPSSPQPDADHWLGEQMQAYGTFAKPGAPGGQPQAAPQGLAGQARMAAEKALANNRSLEARLEAKLDSAGMSFKPAEWLLLRAGVAVVAGIVGVLAGSGSLFLGLLFVVAGLVGALVVLKLKKGKRLCAFDSGLADTLQLMSGSLAAGLSLAQSVDTIVREGQSRSPRSSGGC